MNEKFLIVSTSVLPDYFLNVVKAEELVLSGEMTISQACEQMNISRSTFYKYRNKVFRSNREYTKKSILSFKMIDEKGVLNNILKIFYEFNINIVSINQAMPIRNYSYVIIMVDLSETNLDVQELTKKLKQVNGIKSVNVVFE
ncbi:MAG: ACT domain-containing protein [Clostridiales bacterium]|nr:ACT domain-containing protein [Clostridiales bacterium]